jgi:hypothetical protein
MGSSPPSGLVISFLRVCQWAVLKEANVALRYERARVTACGTGSSSGVDPNEFPFLQEVGAPTLGPVEDLGLVVESMLSKGSQLCKRHVGWGKCCMSKGHLSSFVWTGIRENRLVEMWFPDQISGPRRGEGPPLGLLPCFLLLSRGKSGTRSAENGRLVPVASAET